MGKDTSDSPPIIPTEIIDATGESTEAALGISPERHRKLTWIIDEICSEGGDKATGMRKIAATDTTDVEKVFMGFILCKRYVAGLPYPLRVAALRVIG
jgi:hypothetical protein